LPRQGLIARTWIAALVFAIGAVFGVGVLIPVGVAVWQIRREVARAGSGGIGAVSTGIPEVVTLVIAAVVVVLFVLARRRLGPLAARLQRVHLAITVLLLVLSLPLPALSLTAPFAALWIGNHAFIVSQAGLTPPPPPAGAANSTLPALLIQGGTILIANLLCSALPSGPAAPRSSPGWCTCC
jgi:hypothetical protein